MQRKRRSHCLFSIAPLALLFSMGFPGRAQTPTEPSTPTASPTPSLEKEFLKNVLRDQKAIWTAPFHLHRADAKWIVPAGIGGMALFTTDRITGDKIGEFDRQVKISRIVSYPGSIYGVGAVAATFYLVGRKTNDSRARETGLLSAEALVDSLIVSNVLKAATQRARPLTGAERSEFFDGGSSFPSGHSTKAWSMATIVANEYHDHRAVQVAAYAVATAVSFSRFTGHQHYISDVLAGSALGYGIGQYVYHAHHRENSSSADGDQPPKTSRWPAITPRYSHRARQYGVAFAWSF